MGLREEWDEATPLSLEKEWDEAIPVIEQTHQPVKKPLGGNRLLDIAAGTLETPIALATQAIAQPVSYLGRVGMTALKGGQEGKSFADYLQGVYGYQPQSETGRGAMNLLSTILSPLGLPRKVGEYAGRKIDVATGNKTQDWEEGLGNVAEAPLQALGLKGVIGGLERTGIISKTPTITKVIPETTIDQQIAKVIKEDYYKTIKPATTGRTTYKTLRTYGNKTGNAEKYIVENKNNLSFIDDATGNEITGKLPSTTLENAQAWKQSMENIWQQADELIKAKNGTGITVPTSPFIKQLKIVIEKNKTASPSVAKEAQSLIERLKEQPELTFVQVQEYLAQINNRLASKGTSTYSDYGSMQVDNLHAKYLRNVLDKNIEGIKELRNTYADFKAGEADITRAAARRLNVDPKKMDFLDIGALATAAHAITALQPGGLITAGVIKGANWYRKLQMNPDYNTAQMYKKLDTIINQGKGFNEAFSGGLPKAGPFSYVKGEPGQYLGYEGKFTGEIPKPTTKAIGYDPNIYKQRQIGYNWENMANIPDEFKAVLTNELEGRFRGKGLSPSIWRKDVAEYPRDIQGIIGETSTKLQIPVEAVNKALAKILWERKHQGLSDLLQNYGE